MCKPFNTAIKCEVSFTKVFAHINKDVCIKLLNATYCVKEETAKTLNGPYRRIVSYGTFLQYELLHCRIIPWGIEHKKKIHRGVIK